MTTRKTLLAAGAALLFAGPVLAQVPIGSLGGPGTTIQGTVGEVFGNKFVLRDDTGAVLVEAGPEWFRRLEVRPGERLTVIGKPDGTRSFDAFTIVRENGERIEVRPAVGPAPWSGGERRSEARAELARVSEQAIRERLAALGYRDIRKVEHKRSGFEVEGWNARGERVELHLDRDGNIVRERWKR